ncbi:MAG: nucleotidyltransferase family protein [Pseudomonadota bacterium]
MRNAPDAVMIYAAGFGTRMRPLTDKMPKPLIPVGGRPLIDHALAHVRSIRPRVVAANLHYRADQLVSHLTGSEVVPLVEAPEILDMGGGLKAAAPVLGTGPVWTINPDVLWRGPNPLELALRTWDGARMDALMVCVPMERVLGRDDAGEISLDADGSVTWGPGMVYGGVQIIALDRIIAHPGDVFAIQPIWEAMRAAGRLHGVIYPGTWCDVGTPAGIPVAEAMLADV